jgi:hypothetical protein
MAFLMLLRRMDRGSDGARLPLDIQRLGYRED